jgi:hypothetical protein
MYAQEENYTQNPELGTESNGLRDGVKQSIFALLTAESSAIAIAVRS